MRAQDVGAAKKRARDVSRPDAAPRGTAGMAIRSPTRAGLVKSDLSKHPSRSFPAALEDQLGSHR